nr:PREDICTED: outer dense fiber protein 3B [Haliaeetus albicilla]
MNLLDVPEHQLLPSHKRTGPGTYTLPRLAGPNTAYTHASPCYSMKGKSKHNGFAEDLSKTPGPAAFPKVELDIYKKRAPMYTKGAKSRIGGDKTVKPGPADYCLGEVRQPARPSSSALQQPALKHLPLPTGLLRTQDHLNGVTNCRTAGLLPYLGPKPRTHLCLSTSSDVQC